MNNGTLAVLQKRAYGEIRHNVFMAVGTKLPAELAENVFELAMLAEGMLLDPRPQLISPRQRDEREAVPITMADCGLTRAVFVCGREEARNDGGLSETDSGPDED